MDSRFPVWMHLRLQSQISIDKIVNTIRRMFKERNRRTRLTMKVFSNDKSFTAYLKMRALSNSQLSTFFDPEGNNGSDDDSDGGDSDDGKQMVVTEANDLTTGHAKITHEVNAAGHYAAFLGRSFASARRLAVSLGQITKYLQQADVSIQIQDNASTCLLFDSIRNKLRSRQTSINARISRWLRFGMLAEADVGLQNFGCNELQPYIELCLRYLFLPMSPKRLRNLRMTFEPPPTDVDNLYDKDARTAIFASDDAVTDADDMLFVNGDHLTHMSIVFPNNNSKSNTHGKLVTRDIGQTLSVYIYFFFKYCKGNRNTQRNRNHRGNRGDTYMLFSQIGGGEWKYLLKHVRNYAQRIGLDVDKMGLTKYTSSYMHQSRVAWVASRATDTNHIASDAKAVNMGFGQDHKFYPGLESLRRTNRARERLGGWIREETKHTEQGLLPVPESLYPLLMEMRGIRGNNPSFEGKMGKGEYKWKRVYHNDDLYSNEFKQYIGGASNSVYDFLKAEKNKAQKAAIYQNRVYDFRPRRGRKME
jgi:hypothetical protein